MSARAYLASQAHQMQAWWTSLLQYNSRLIQSPVVHTHLSCRSLTLRCCGFHSLPDCFTRLTKLEYLDIMDPYLDLQVLQHVPALNWLRLVVYGFFDLDRPLKLNFPPSLCFLDVKSNVRRTCKDGFLTSCRTLKLLVFAGPKPCVWNMQSNSVVVNSWH